MGPPPQRHPGTHVETRYYIDAQGTVSQRQVRVADTPHPTQTPQAEYKYYRQPDGTVVRRRVASQPSQPPSQQLAPQAPATYRPGPQQQRAARPAAVAPPPPPHRVHPTPATRTPRWTAKRIAKHLVVIAIIIILLLIPSTTAHLQALVDTILTGQPSFQFFPETADITLERRDSLTSSGALTWHISIPEPYHIPKIHEVLSLTTSPNPTERYVYKDQDWMKWEGAIAPGGGTASFTITYHMKLTSTLWDVDDKDSATVSDVESEYLRYLGDEWKITPSDPQVQTLSKQIVGEESDVYTILLKIYKWMDSNLKYQTQRSSEPKSCSQTLADRNGDCDDQSILLASLARAAGVPVWLNLGIIYDPVRDYWGGHGWNNVYIPLEKGGHVIATVDVVNDQFLFRDPYHVSDYLDNGNGDDLKDYYTSWSYTYSSGSPPSVSSQEVYNILNIKTDGSVIYTKPK